MRELVLFVAAVLSTIAAVGSLVLAWLEYRRQPAGPARGASATSAKTVQPGGVVWFAAGVVLTGLAVALLLAARHQGCGDAMPPYSNDRSVMAKRWCVPEEQLIQPASLGWQFQGNVPVWSGMCLDLNTSTDQQFTSHLQRGAAAGPISYPVPGRARAQLTHDGNAVGIGTLYWAGCPPGQ